MADVLGAFEQAVLLAIIRLRDDAYGRAIVGEVAERLRRDVSIGAVHATLVRLERKGMLSSRLAPGTVRRAGRRRRFYRVDARALRALDEARKSYGQMWRGIRWPILADA